MSKLNIRKRLVIEVVGDADDVREVASALEQLDSRLLWHGNPILWDRHTERYGTVLVIDPSEHDATGNNHDRN